MTTSRRLAALLVAAAMMTAACGSSDGSNPTTSTTLRGSDSSSTTTTAPPAPIADQRPPRSTFGLAFHDNKVWVADFYGGQVLAVDPDSGAILRRFEGADGVSDEVDDVAIGPDGAVYWTGFSDGAVGRMGPNNVSTPVDALPPGANGIAFSPDGKHLFVGRAVIGDGLWEYDPSAQKARRQVTEAMGNVNAFAVADDGSIYGPRYGLDGRGTIVRIDTTNGSITEFVAGFDGPIAAKFSPLGDKLYVLSLPPGGKPRLDAVDLATRTIAPLPAPLTPLVDNLTVAPDGRIFVSSFNEAKLTVIRPDGTPPQPLRIGHT